MDRLLPVWILALAPTLAAPAGDWPMLGRDPARSGYAPETLKGPYKRIWYKDFLQLDNDTCASATQVVVAGGLAYIGTCGGNLYALDASVGTIQWKTPIGGAILHSAAVADGRVFVGTLQRGLVALDAFTGKELWTFATGPGGVWNAPLVIDGRVIFGSRDGSLYALEAATGRLVWRHSTDAPILNSPASDGALVFVGSEDMRVRAVGLKDGWLRWKSGQLWGQSLRHYHPVVDVSNNVLYMTTTPAVDPTELLLAGHVAMLRPFGFTEAEARQTSAAIVRLPRFKEWLSRFQKPRTALLEQEADSILKALDEKPHLQTVFVVDGRTGKRQTRKLPILYQGGAGGATPPPVVRPQGEAFTLYRTAFSQYVDWGVAYANGAVGRVDLTNRRIQQLTGANRQWGQFWLMGDEQAALTACKNAVFIAHSMAVGGVETTTRARFFTVSPGRHKLAGLPNRHGLEDGDVAGAGPSGPGQAGVVIADGRLFWTVGSALVAFEGAK